MSENTGKKKRPASKSPSSKTGSSGSGTSKKPGSKRPEGSASSKGQGVNLQKKSKLAGRTVEMSSGRQVSIDEIMKENDTSAADSPEKNNAAKNTAPKEEAAQLSDVKSSLGDEDNGPNEQIEWNKQVGSIVIWMISIILIALTFFPGESLWTIIHNFILGILGFKAYLWAALLIFLGYLLTKQRNEIMIMNIIRPTAGIIILSDVLSYILVQSNGYRNVFNELALNFFQLLGQIFIDGSKIGGTGLLGGIIGELLIFIAGKNGAAIITCILMTALIMLVSHTGPIALFEDFKRKIKALLQPGAVRNGIKEIFEELFGKKQHDENVDYDYDYDDTEYDIDIIDDEIVPPSMEPESEPDTEDIDVVNDGDYNADNEIDEFAKKVSLKKKKKKLSKAEEIKAESEEFSKQVESEEDSDGEKEENEYRFPPLRLLFAPKNVNSADDELEKKETADMLIGALEEYGVKAAITNVSRGPTVTRYEIKPAPGVKINKITNLSNDIAMRLAAQSIRIEAPIPGKAAVGIEIPNQNKQMVHIREILGSRKFNEAKGSLTVALGKDIEGNIILCDLSKMPHLLIAGSTGSGKSVCVNSMLMSILYKYSPEDVRMVLIDPKAVEFDMYNGIPHLLVPVVCEPKKAAGALQWAVSEMLKRYGMLKEHGARNIDNYNRLAEQTGEFEKLCRIVIVIDEMADLMIASPKEVEDAIARLAAMARAAGMHMVLATQRPSVDVITGTIKNNIPSRIALAVSSQVDSRTILDEGGAENLIGYGDMLFHQTGSSKNVRVQGCFVDDIEVERVIKFVKQNGQAEYDDTIADEIERKSLEGAGEGSTEFEGKDENFEKAVEVVTEAGQASTSMLQRRLGVGYARAGRIIDQLEEQGIIGPYEGSKPRAVLITRAQWLEMTMSRVPSGKNDPLVRSHSEFAAQTLNIGHEEITARQSEFFNADLVNENEDETVIPEGDETSYDSSDISEEHAQYEFQKNTEESAVDVEIDDDEIEDVIEDENEDEIEDDIEEEDDTEHEEDMVYDDDYESKKPEVTAPIKNTPPVVLTKEKARKSPVDMKKAENPSKNVPGQRRAKTKHPAPRDFSIFFDDEEDDNDLFVFASEREQAAFDIGDGMEDIPPWEEYPYHAAKSENTADDTSIESHASHDAAADEWEPDNQTQGESVADGTYDDDDDDILSSSWIKKL